MNIKFYAFLLFCIFSNFVNAQGFYQYSYNNSFNRGFLNYPFNNFNSNSGAYVQSGVNFYGAPYFNYYYQNSNNLGFPLYNQNFYYRQPVSPEPLFYNQWNSIVTPNGYRPYHNPYFQMATQGIGGW